MRTGKRGIDLIKGFEGLELVGYLCPANIPTIGYGHTGPEVKVGKAITPDKAVELLAGDLAKFERGVRGVVKSDINQNQFDALVSFAYNCGLGNLYKSTLLKKVNANPDDPTIAKEFQKWTRGGGKILPGLVRRRKAEAALYFS